MPLRSLLYSLQSHGLHLLGVASAAATFLLLMGPKVARAQPDPMVRVAVRGDSAYVYHTKRLPAGHGFHVSRKQGNGEFEQITETPVRGIRRANQLPVRLGPRYEWLERHYDENSPTGVYYTMRGDWTNGLFAAFLDPDIARALGLLHVDGDPPVGEEVTYRITFVDDEGSLTETELTKTVSLQPTAAPAPDALEAEHEGRRMTLSWDYPTTSREEDDKIIRFDVYRVVGEDEAERVNGQEIILRNSAVTQFSYVFTVPRTGREETFFVAAVDITGRAAVLSDRLTYRVTDNVAPAPIGGVEVYEESSGEAHVSWSVHTAPDVAGYHLYRAPRLEAEFRRVNLDRLDLLETSYIDTTVVGRKSYHYRVTAVDSAGNESDMSNAALAQVVDHEPPPSPRDLEATFQPNDDGGSVRLQWSVANVPPDLRTFQVLRRRLGEGTGPTSYAQANTMAVRDTTFADAGVGRESEFAEGAFYHYAVVAIDSARNISDSTFARIQIPDRTAPEPPSEIQALNEEGVRTLVKWTPATALDVTTYRVYRQVGNGPDTLWTEVPSDVHHVADDRVETGRRYQYTVSAVDSVGNEGPRSAPAEILMRDFAAPAAVRNVQAQARDEDGVRIRWESVSAEDVTGYRVYRTATIPTGIYDPVHEQLVSGTEFTDSEGEPDMWYRVRAVDASGNESSPSQPARAVPSPEQ